MSALRIRLHAAIRSRWRAWLMLSLLAGALSGIVVAGWAGAERTQGSYNRYLGSINGADVYVDPFVFEGGDSLPLDGVAKLPQVARTERSLQLAVLARTRDGHATFPLGPNSIGWVLPTDDRSRDEVDRLKLLHGRLPDPREPDEVIGDTGALAIFGIHVGDTLVIRNVSQHHLDHDVFHLYSDPLTTKLGQLVRLHVVGVAANARPAVDGGQMHLTPAFFHKYGERKLGAFIEELEIRLKRGQRDLPAFKAALSRYAGKRPFLLFEPSTTQPTIQHSIDLQARALWVVTGLGALGALILIGQALLRLAADESGGDETLRALGADARDQLLFALSRAALIAAGALVVAAAVAFLCSGLMPIGWARELDPDGGFQFDAGVIVPGLAATYAAMLAFGAIGGVRQLLAGRARRMQAGPDATRRATRFLRGHGSPTFVAGMRMALGSGAGRSARGTLAAAVIAVTVSVTAVTFAASFHHLTTTPRLYGQTWDYEGGFGQPVPRKVADGVARERGVIGLGLGTDETLTVNGVDTGVRAWTDRKGAVPPELTAGRRPRGVHEIALATKTLSAVHARVGDYVSVRAGNRTRRMHVVGRIVLPSGKFNKLGYGGVLSFAALKRIDTAAQPTIVLVRLAPGAAAAERRLNEYFDSNVVIRPNEVGDFGRIDNMPLYIALLAIAAAAAALAHALVTSVQRGRRDLAMLKALGFTPRQVAETVAWDATAVVAAATLIGLPLGVLVGRFTWHLFAADLGVAPEVVVPALPLVLALPVALVVGNGLAAVPGVLAARIRPAPVLRTE
jgi:ABC-type lipoprotein release transport system permease subunit